MKHKIGALAGQVLHSESARFQVVRLLMVGGSGVVFNWVVFSLLRHFTSLSTLECTAIVHVVILVVVFPLQKLFTFKKRDRGHVHMARFLVNDAGYVALDYALAYAFIDMLGLPAFIGKGCGLMILTPLSFLSQRYWVFR